VLMDQLVELLIGEETIEGPRFRELVARHEQAECLQLSA
jgi:hypothetical protein